MKNLIGTLFISLMIFAGIKCGKHVDDLPSDPVKVKRITLKEAITKANSACGFANPDESLRWLKDIIVKAEEDIETRNNLSNHIGRIYLHVYQNKPLFYIQMPLGSSGLPGHIFDCTGTTVTTSQNGDILSFPVEPQKHFQLIYSNVPPY